MAHDDYHGGSANRVGCGRTFRNRITHAPQL